MGAVENRRCKGCSDQYRVTEAQVARILQSSMFQSDLCVPDMHYEERLNACRSCDKLMDGFTCSLCGCIVQVAAKLKEKRCPLPGNDRWA